VMVATAAPQAAPPAPAPRLVIVPEPATPLPLVTPASPTPPAAPPAVRLSGVELIADLFECMHDLHFLPDALAGADFVLRLMLDKLPSAVALVHFYDIDAREFVVVRAVGVGAAKVMQLRTNEKEPLIAEAMHKRRAVVLDDATGDSRAQNGRWALIGDPPRSLVCAPVEEGGRFLGLLELTNPLDGQPFHEGDGHAITYIGEQFAEFLAARGVVLDPERIGD
jgi:GAF domain-containing protein